MENINTHYCATTGNILKILVESLCQNMLRNWQKKLTAMGKLNCIPEFGQCLLEEYKLEYCNKNIRTKMFQLKLWQSRIFYPKNCKVDTEIFRPEKF